MHAENSQLTDLYHKLIFHDPLHRFDEHIRQLEAMIESQSHILTHRENNKRCNYAHTEVF